MTGPPYETLPPDAPATVEDVRASRRWTWVAFAWAIAASVIAVLALIQANKDNSNDNNAQTQTTPNLSGQVAQFEKQVNDRLDQFSKRLNGVAAGSDVTKLDKRLSKVEDDQSKLDTSTSDQATTLKQMRSDLDDLTKRVSQLERQQSQSGGGGTGTSSNP